jgi:hypothetical protein
VYVKACICTLQGSCVALRFWNRLLQGGGPEVLSGLKSNLGQICGEIVEKVRSHPWRATTPARAGVFHCSVTALPGSCQVLAS